LTSTAPGAAIGGVGGGVQGSHLPPELQFDDSWSTQGYVRFRRPKRGSRFLDNALTALEWFTNQVVYSGNWRKKGLANLLTTKHTIKESYF